VVAGDWIPCLQNAHDGNLLEWYTTSELVSVKVATGEMKTLGPARMYVACDPSPDSQLMVVSWIERPFSFELPAGRFPRVWQVWDRFDPEPDLTTYPFLALMAGYSGLDCTLKWALSAFFTGCLL
jgi:hypothetical protein